MLPVILAGADAVHFLVVLAHQRLPPLWVLPNPVPEGFPDCHLLLGGKGGFFGVEYPALPPLGVLNGVIDADIPQV